jgi:hypothetical protein
MSRRMKNRYRVSLRSKTRNRVPFLKRIPFRPTYSSLGFVGKGKKNVRLQHRPRIPKKPKVLPEKTQNSIPLPEVKPWIVPIKFDSISLPLDQHEILFPTINPVYLCRTNSKAPSRILVFINSWGEFVYHKLYKYLQFVMKELSIPFQVFDTIQDCARKFEGQSVQILAFIAFDALYQLYYAQSNLPHFRRIQYILLVSEPNHNIEGIMDLCSKHMDMFYAVLNFNTIQDELFARLFPNKLQFHCMQGYLPLEDFEDQIPESERVLDVLAPGFCNSSQDRKSIVVQLRQRGLTVKDDVVFHQDLDRATRTCKIQIVYPYNKNYDTWHGQRTLWALNKQTCVVSVASGDMRAEKFYSGLIINATRESFIDTVVRVVQSGRWRTHGREAYQRYKTEFYCANVFNLKLYTFCREWTNK